MEHTSIVGSSRPRLPGLLLKIRTEFESVLPVGARWLFLAWALYSGYVFLHAEAAVPDELNFLDSARNTGYWALLTSTPPALYGSLFWIGLKALGSAFAARLMVLAMFLLTPYLVLRTIEAPRLKLAVLLLWLTFPIAWWAGKLIAPEIPTMFLVALALHMLHHKRMVACAIALGAAVGIKVSVLPALGFFFAAYLLQADTDWRVKLRAIPTLVAVFLVAVLVTCPPIIDIVREVRKQPGNPVVGSMLDQLHAALLVTRWEWDTVFSGGVLRFSLMPVPLALIALATLARDWRMVLATLVSVCGFSWMSIHSATFYGWYWITLFPIVLYVVSRKKGDNPPGWLYAALIGAAAINAVQQLPLITDQLYQKSEQIRVLGKREEIRACIVQKLDELKPKAIYNLAEFGMPVNYPALVYVWPEPKAYAADVLLIGTRHLVNRRSPSMPWTYGTRLYATCDAVLIFSRE